MNQFKKAGGFKKSFKKGSFDGQGREGGPELHPATCSSCGRACEVPFRPTGDRPVYCRDCFGKNMAARESGDAPRREFGNGGHKPPFRPANNEGPRERSFAPQTASAHSPEFGKLARQLETLNATIEKLSSILEASIAATVPVAPAKKLRKKKAA